MPTPMHGPLPHSTRACDRAARCPGAGSPRLTTSAVAVATLAIVLAAAIAIGRDPENAGAVTVLRDAARKLEAAPATPLGAGQYWYVEQRGHTLAEEREQRVRELRRPDDDGAQALDRP